MKWLLMVIASISLSVGAKDSNDECCYLKSSSNNSLSIISFNERTMLLLDMESIRSNKDKISLAETIRIIGASTGEKSIRGLAFTSNYLINCRELYFERLNLSVSNYLSVSNEQKKIVHEQKLEKSPLKPYMEMICDMRTEYGSKNFKRIYHHFFNKAHLTILPLIPSKAIGFGDIIKPIGVDNKKQNYLMKLNETGIFLKKYNQNFKGLVGFPSVLEVPID